MKKTTTKAKKVRFGFRHNIKIGTLLLVLPIAVGVLVAAIIGSGVYAQNIAQLGSARLDTQDWQFADTALKQDQPEYQRQFAYYKIKDGQTIEQVAEFFSVDVAKLIELNPGRLVTGTTIKVTPVEKQLTPTLTTNGAINGAIIIDDAGLLRITNKHNRRQPIVTNIPELAQYLAPYNAIEQTGPTSYRINRAISLDGDIRLDITDKTVTNLELHSGNEDAICLCMDGSAVLIDNVNIISYDPETKKADTNISDGRSFIRMKNGRMDIINSHISFLGNGLRKTLTATAAEKTIQKEGGLYGVSWRISDDQLGQQIATGWVDNNTFTRNHFGTYSYGASGMLWRGNQFSYNDVYGLDPHDDSNNALIENNVFHHNGTHGFIVSKRCNYNIIRNNTSFSNGLHGYMLHQDSAYNLIENNVSYDNVDNYVIYESNFNTIRNNKSYAPSSSHIRINRPSHNNYVMNNELFGGQRGVFLYDGVTNTLVANNTIIGVEKVLHTNEAQNTVFTGNQISGLNYDLGSGDRLVFGDNHVTPQKFVIPSSAPMPQK